MKNTYDNRMRRKRVSKQRERHTHTRQDKTRQDKKKNNEIKNYNNQEKIKASERVSEENKKIEAEINRRIT